MRLYATHPRRVKGDGYAGGGDLLSPPLAMLSVAALVIALFYGPAFLGFVLAYVIIAIYHTVLGTRIAIHAGKPIGRRFAMVGVMRAYARGFGMMQGLVDVLFRRTR